MIKSFRDKETERIFNRLLSKKLPQTIQQLARRKLVILDSATDLLLGATNNLYFIWPHNGHVFLENIFSQHEVDVVDFEDNLVHSRVIPFGCGDAFSPLHCF